MDFTLERTKLSKKTFFKKSARKMLYDNWMGEIFVFLIVGAVFVGICGFGSNFASLIYNITQNTNLYTLCNTFYEALSVVVMIPLVLGLVKYHASYVDKAEGNLYDLFYFFSSPDNMLRSYETVLGFLIRAIVYFLPAIAIRVFLYFFYYDGIFGISALFSNVDIINFAFRSAFILLLYLGLVLSSRCFFGVYLCVTREDLSVSRCYFASKICTYGTRKQAFCLYLSFLPVCVLSLFTFGLLFVVYTLPIMMLTFTSYYKYLYQREMVYKNATSSFYNQNM